MQRIRLTRGLLTELARCDKSFVLSLFWHGLDNESLQQKGGLAVDNQALYDARRDLIYGMEGIANSLGEMENCVPVFCSSDDVQSKLDQTYSYITQAESQGVPAVIADGMLEGGSFVVPFSVLVVKADGTWEVYHQSTKSFGLETLKEYNKALSTATSDAAPLMYVLATHYADKVARFAVIAPNKRYLTGYPDPVTGKINVDPNEAMYYLDINLNTDSIGNYLGLEDPEAKVAEIQQIMSYNPFYIPEDSMHDKMSSCNGSSEGYPCPYKAYCERELTDQNPDSVRLHLGGVDANKCIKRGIDTMQQLLMLSYEDPTLESIGASDVLLYELNLYEQRLCDGSLGYGIIPQ